MDNKEKHKALEILEKFIHVIDESDFHIPQFISGIKMADGSPEYEKVLNVETKELAKQCALICAQECGKSAPYLTFKDHPLGERAYAETVEFWQKVKLEINKI